MVLNEVREGDLEKKKAKHGDAPCRPALKRFKHENHEFEASLSCTVSTRPEGAYGKTLFQKLRGGKTGGGCRSLTCVA